jgi:hypothetical protein
MLARRNAFQSTEIVVSPGPMTEARGLDWRAQQSVIARSRRPDAHQPVGTSCPSDPEDGHIRADIRAPNSADGVINARTQWRKTAAENELSDPSCEKGAFAEPIFPMAENCVGEFSNRKLQTISFSPFNGRILTTLRAGLALNIVS